MPRYTKQEIDLLQTAAKRVWSEQQFDIASTLRALGENRITRNEVIEAICDANRLSVEVAKRDKALAQKIDDDDYDNLIALLKPCFSAYYSF